MDYTWRSHRKRAHSGACHVTQHLSFAFSSFPYCPIEIFHMQVKSCCSYRHKQSNPAEPTHSMWDIREHKGGKWQNAFASTQSPVVVIVFGKATWYFPFCEWVLRILSSQHPHKPSVMVSYCSSVILPLNAQKKVNVLTESWTYV